MAAARRSAPKRTASSIRKTASTPDDKDDTRRAARITTDDGKHAGDKYPGGKHDGKHDGKDGHKGPVLVDCKHPMCGRRAKAA